LVLALNGCSGLLLVFELDVGKSVIGVRNGSNMIFAGYLLPLAQSPGIRGNDNILDGTELLKLAGEIFSRDIKEKVADIDSRTWDDLSRGILAGWATSLTSTIATAIAAASVVIWSATTTSSIAAAVTAVTTSATSIGATVTSPVVIIRP